MNRIRIALSIFLVGLAMHLAAQNNAGLTGGMPRLVSYSGRITDMQGKSLPGVVGATFSVYKEQEGGAPLWMETQNLQVDAAGNFTVELGSTLGEGLPLDLFSSGQARWLGVRIHGKEGARVLLLSVPYAMKAADAETIGGLPPSAFVLAAPSAGGNQASVPAGSSSASGGVTTAVSGSGTTDYLPLWTPNGTTLGSSVLFQSGAGATAKIGIDTTTPSTTLDVKGAATVRGILSLPVTGSATASAGKNSQPESFTASAFNSGSKAAVNEIFRLQAEPVGNNSTTPSGSLNLLYASGSASPAETGLKISSKGQITFASGQTFPGVGTVSSVGFSAPSSDFTVTGIPVIGSGTINLGWVIAPTSLATENAIVKRDDSGSFAAGAIQANASNIGVSATGGSDGVYGTTTNSAGNGVWGYNPNHTGVYGDGAVGIWGHTGTGYAVYGENDATSGGAADGVHGITQSSAASGVAGVNLNGGVGVYGAGGTGVYATSSGASSIGLAAYNTSTGDAIFAENQSGGFAAFFLGNVDVDGSLSKAGGSFKIDHPLDPANKYLYHSFVESPDMKNIYDGTVTTDANGDAVVTMPDWFEALNRDFRYQLTVIGQFAQAIVATKMANGAFSVKTDKPNVEVSWQVTGTRHDAWANANRIPVEQLKTGKERGRYLYPQLFGASPEQSIARLHGASPKTLSDAQKPKGTR